MNKFLQTSIFIVAIVLIGSALLLIVNTKSIVTDQTRDSTVVVVQIDSAGQTLSKQITTSVSPAKPCETCVQKSYETAMGYFGLAGLLLAVAFLLPRIKSMNIGGNSIEVKEEALRELNAQQNASVGVGGKGETLLGDSRPKNQARETIETNKGHYNNDPQKDKWGGKPIAKGRELYAEVKKLGESGYYSIDLIVQSLNPKGNPLTGFVAFHLHPSFANPNPVINVVKGKATLNLTAYGSFTVGAVCDNGQTKLEIDLEKIAGVDDNFKNS